MLRSWLVWLTDQHVAPTDAGRSDVEAYGRHLEAAGYATSTIGQRLSVISSFFRWCLREQHVTVNPVDGARRLPRPTTSTTQAVSRHELTDWLDTAEVRGGYPYATARWMAGRPARCCSTATGGG